MPEKESVSIVILISVAVIAPHPVCTIHTRHNTQYVVPPLPGKTRIQCLFPFYCPNTLMFQCVELSYNTWQTFEQGSRLWNFGMLELFPAPGRFFRFPDCHPLICIPTSSGTRQVLTARRQKNSPARLFSTRYQVYTWYVFSGQYFVVQRSYAECDGVC